ncbi:hypothetical protein VKT23_020681 [Stygiomarasmius scandens]|uniref:Uncharacterized protein n=1 Tax=Marasmiellus scandens TaxID=2682957 RepID=A0ABR1IKY5_9AGAR
MPLPIVNFNNFRIGWAHSNTTTILRLPTLASIQDDAAGTPSEGTAEERTGLPEDNCASGERTETLPTPTNLLAVSGTLESRTLRQDVRIGIVPDPQIAKDSPTLTQPSPKPLDHSLELPPVVERFQTPEASNNLESIAASISSNNRISPGDPRRRIKRMSKRVRGSQYILPPITSHATFISRNARIGIAVRWYMLCNDKSVNTPIATSEAPWLNDLFIHVSHRDAQCALDQDMLVLFQHVKLWVFTDRGWESIKFGDQRHVDGQTLALTINIRFEPSWVKPATMARDDRFKRIHGLD